MKFRWLSIYFIRSRFDFVRQSRGVLAEKPRRQKVSSHGGGWQAEIIFRNRALGADRASVAEARMEKVLTELRTARKVRVSVGRGVMSFADAASVWEAG